LVCEFHELPAHEIAPGFHSKRPKISFELQQGFHGEGKTKKNEKKQGDGAKK
jgi:hypothetical protein